MAWATWSLSALADTDGPLHIRHLAVTAMPGSGKPDEIVSSAGIDAAAIEDAARKLIG